MVDAALWNSNDLSVELRLVKETARRFAEESLRPLVARRTELKDLPVNICRTYSELGLGVAYVPRIVGGVGLGPVAACLTDEALAAGDVNGAFALPQPGPFVDLVAILGNRHQRKIWLLPFLRDAARTWGALVMGPPGALRGQVVNGALVLHGEVQAVWSAGQAERLAVVADEVDGTGALTGGRVAAVLEREDEGVQVSEPLELPGLPLARACKVSFAGARAVKSQWLAKEHLEAALDHVFCAQALRMASYALGAARAASAYVLDYAESRRRAGRPLAHYQSMGFLLVDMHLAAETALSRLRQAAKAAADAALGHTVPADPGGGGEAPAQLTGELARELTKLRAEADEVAFFVTDSALQMLEDSRMPNNAETSASAAAATATEQAHPVAGWHRDVTLLARSYPAALRQRQVLPEAGKDGGPAWFV